MTKIFSPPNVWDIQQHCDKAENGGGRKNSGRRNQCLLTWIAKEFNYTRAYFLVALTTNMHRVRGKRTTGLCSEGRPGELHFRVPHEDNGTPAAVDGSGEQKKKGARAFMSPASLAPILRGVTRSIYPTQVQRGRDEDNCEFAFPNSRLRFANRKIGNGYR